MTKEEESIENLTKLLKQRNEKQVQITTYNLFENIETVLFILKQNSAELAEKSAEIEKKDKIIDLMAERLRFDEELKFEVCRDCEPLKEELCGEPTKTQYQPTELKCVKQYFERKVKNEL